MTDLPYNLIHLLQRLWTHFSRRRKRQFGVLLGLMILASFAEIISIGSVLPFLAVLTDPQRVYDLPILSAFISYFGIKAPAELLLPITVVFCSAAIIAAIVRLILLRSSLFLSAAIGSDIGYDMYQRTLYQPYIIQISRNSSEIIDGISIKSTTIAHGVVMPLLYIASSVIIASIIFSALIWFAPETTLSAFFIFATIYFAVIKFTRKQQVIDSKNIARESPRVIKSLQEGLGGIRDVLLDGTQETFCRIYRHSDLLLRRSYASSSFISVSPRFAVEGLGILLIALLAYLLANKPDGVSKAIPILGALALAAQRLLPLMQQAYSSWANLRQNHHSLQDTLDFLDQPLPNRVDESQILPLSFHHSIVLNQIFFAYAPTSQPIFSDISLTIPKGTRIGFIGETGSGKSTLIDIIMGLLQPTSGYLLVDGIQIGLDNLRSWQKNIAHVPQSIFLADGSIAENIAFGIPKEKIDLQRVENAAIQAQIYEMIQSLPEKYNTLIGERGVRLSGGQRQRIGIARAIYKQASVIIFDEATSALDNETENAVMESIDNLSNELTILIIAHRLSTLKNCDEIYEIKKNQINIVK